MPDEARQAMRRIFQRHSPHQAVDFVAPLEQQFGKIGAVLPGDAGNQSALHSSISHGAC